MAWIYGRDERLYLAKATDYKTIRNTTGAASVAATDACLHTAFSASRAASYLQPPDKESTATIGYKDRAIPGKLNASPASIGTPMFTASGAGVQPDNGILFESAFGKVTISAGVSVTYGPDGTRYLNETTPVAVEAWQFVTGGKRQKAVVGVVNQLVIQGAQDFVSVQAELLCFNVLTQDRFAASSTAEKMGLTAWPTEPASQTYTGAEMMGFTGVMTLDGDAYTTVRNFTLTYNFNRQFRSGKFANDGTEFLPSDIYEGQPEFTLDVDLWSEASNADLDALVAKIAARTSFDGSVEFGTVAGGTYLFSLNDLIVPDGHEIDHADGDDRKVVSIRGLRAQITPGSRNEGNLVIT